MSLSHCVTIIHRPTWVFFKSGGTPLLAPTFTSHLNLRLLETPLRPTLDTPLLGHHCLSQRRRPYQPVNVAYRIGIRGVDADPET